MPAESVGDVECGRCDDARVVFIYRCQPTCSRIRGCAPDCPRRVSVACPACARRELGEDLNS